MCLTRANRVDAARARRLTGILKFSDATAWGSFLGHSRLATGLVNSRVSTYSGGLSNKLWVYPPCRWGFVGSHHISVVHGVVTLTAVSGGFVDPDL